MSLFFEFPRLFPTFMTTFVSVLLFHANALFFFFFFFGFVPGRFCLWFAFAVNVSWYSSDGESFFHDGVLGPFTATREPHQTPPSDFKLLLFFTLFFFFPATRFLRRKVRVFFNRLLALSLSCPFCFANQVCVDF